MNRLVLIDEMGDWSGRIKWEGGGKKETIGGTAKIISHLSSHVEAHYSRNFLRYIHARR